jgi:hypothetical protein
MAHQSTKSLSMKRIGVDKTNARIVAITAAAAFVVVFFLVASVALFSQLTYQNRIIAAKKTAVAQLKKNLTARDSLVTSYENFAGATTNFIGGNATGSGSQDGNNAKLVLDALPSTYDFPALATSLEKIATDQGVTIQSLTGIDDEVAQTANQSTNTPVPIAMPFEIKVSGSYANIQSLVDAFDHSIRPIQVQKIDLTGDQTTLNLDVTAQTFYQPQRTLNIQTEVIK